HDGGEFFTPVSLVQMIVNVIEPDHGSVIDPACGSGGMFVQSQQFIDQHRKELKEQGEKHDEDQIFVYGQEKTGDTVKLAKMNLAVNGLKGEIKQANSYSEDPFDGFGKFDYVMANPPFNVDDVPIATVESDERFNTYGIPRNKTKAKKSEQAKETVTNANYLWINLFATSLKAKGRAALVMANSASDAGHSEADIRQKLIENNLIYGMLTLPSNMFFTVTLPATLWFFDKDKKDDKILFIDARNVFTQIDRAHREFNQEQIQNLALISKLHKGQQIPFIRLIDSYFANGMERLIENQKQVVPVSEKLVAALEDKQGKNAVSDLMQQWAEFKNLQKSYQDYLKKHQTKKISSNGVKDRNEAQHLLRENFDSFFVALHDGLKEIDKIVRQHEKTKAEAEKKADKRSSVDQKTKQLKLSLEQLHNEVRGAEGYYKHIKWLQDRFPKAKYEDVIGLCKLATPSEVKDQGYSLNSGRYIGVVIEEDGKTEEEFIAELTSLNDDLSEANIFSQKIVKVINNNISKLAGPQ
ncbi:MAG: N-6 DNA methylase, partial [SAR324 cluster bacterium]|nr:N-6 DNA methylase [SAR324 cluster bacterium]